MAIIVSKLAILPIAACGTSGYCQNRPGVVPTGQEEIENAETQLVRSFGSKAGKGGGGRRLSKAGPRARATGGHDNGLVRAAPRSVDVRRVRRVRRRGRTPSPSQRTDRTGADGAGPRPARVAARHRARRGTRRQVAEGGMTTSRS